MFGRKSPKSGDSFGFLAEFQNQDELLAAIPAGREKGYSKMEAYTPLPVHEVWEALGHKSHLPKLVLGGGITGAVVGFGTDGVTFESVLGLRETPWSEVAALFLETFADPGPVFEKADLTPVRRDFAFVVSDDTAAGAIVKAAQGADKALVTAVDVFDVYQGQGIEPGQKSIAIEVTLQPRGETLKDQDIEAISQKIVAAVAKSTGGVLRG